MPEQTQKIQAFVLGGRGIASEIRADETQEISRKFGLSLINGSLNLISKSPVWLDTDRAIYTNGNGHFYWRASLNGIPVIVNRWIRRCPVHIYEVFAEEHLRSRFGLVDGDAVTLEISNDIVDKERNSSALNRLVWYLAWRGRERFAYRDGFYTGLAFHWRIYKLTGRAYQS